MQNDSNRERDLVLEGKRPGKLFTENNMRIYDVEVFDIKLGDNNIEKLLIQAQQDVIKQNLNISVVHFGRQERCRSVWELVERDGFE